jgi:hypothetical protein
LSFDATFYSDLKDLIFSNNYADIRDMNFALSLLAIFIKHKGIADNIYIDKKRIFSDKLDLIKDNDISTLTTFLEQNASEIEINTFEEMLHDILFYDNRTSAVADIKNLTDDLEQRKQKLVEILKIKLKNSDLAVIDGTRSNRKLYRLSYVYGFDDIIKIKVKEYLEKTDNEIVSMLKHFCSKGWSSSVGTTYTLQSHIILKDYTLRSEYYERLKKIKENNLTLIQNPDFIGYYEINSNHFHDDKPKHIVDVAIESIELLDQSKEINA